MPALLQVLVQFVELEVVRSKELDDSTDFAGYPYSMSIDDIQAAVMQLPEDQRARLAGELLASLPAILVDEDDGVAEAKRRSKELEDDPGSGCSWEDIKRNHGR